MKKRTTKREKLNWFIGGGFGFWIIVAFGFFIYAATANNLVQADFRIAAGFFCLTWSMIAEARRAILNAIHKQKEEDNDNS